MLKTTGNCSAYSNEISLNVKCNRPDFTVFPRDKISDSLFAAHVAFSRYMRPDPWFYFAEALVSFGLDSKRFVPIRCLIPVVVLCNSHEIWDSLLSE